MPTPDHTGMMTGPGEKSRVHKKFMTNKGEIANTRMTKKSEIRGILSSLIRGVITISVTSPCQTTHLQIQYPRQW